MSDDRVDILLVEDNADDLELMRHALRRSGAGSNVRVARDGAEALDFIFRTGAYRSRGPETDPALILLDLSLPKVGGLDVLREIKSNPATRIIPVVVLTTSRQLSDVRESYRLGANSYIVKSADFEQFRRSVEEIERYWLTLNEPLPETPAGRRRGR
jgi:CheY-like chemotaxis protein